MLRRIFFAAVLAGAAAFGIYGWLTAPPIMLAVASSAYTPDLANGLTTFNAGGCSSCHAVPGQPDRTRLGGGLAIPSPFGTFYAPNISPDPVDGIGRWSEAGSRGDPGNIASWISLLSGLSLCVLPACQGFAISAVASWFETREDALLTMRVLILRSPLLRASRRMKQLKWKTL
jgi:hypothetical protein